MDKITGNLCKSLELHSSKPDGELSELEQAQVNIILKEDGFETLNLLGADRTYYAMVMRCSSNLFPNVINGTSAIDGKSNSVLTGILAEARISSILSKDPNLARTLYDTRDSAGRRIITDGNEITDLSLAIKVFIKYLDKKGVFNNIEGVNENQIDKNVLEVIDFLYPLSDYPVNVEQVLKFYYQELNRR